ncbi:hypothetical protein [Halomarina ordinaria]|uniref:Uncharacterized protein n=1 Tax=Halomarina ordinaria TaxID=3033939 RepID=A0ABD5U6M8_9EURY|nr:hypothetical protein [Halomarina sp. PSRA2]
MDTWSVSGRGATVTPPSREVSVTVEALGDDWFRIESLTEGTYSLEVCRSPSDLAALYQA